MKKFLGIIFTLTLTLVLASCGKHTHTFSEDWSKDAISHWHAATCDHLEEVSEKADHTWDGGKVTLEPTEQAEGKKVFTCTVCEYTKEEKISKLTHEHSWVDADCTTPKTCSKCNATEGEALGHTPAAAVQENVVAATCKAAGSYDLVVYCSVCEAEISREAKTVEKLAHTPAEAVKENEVAATCKAAGSYDLVVYCSVAGCGAEISRETKTVDKLAHTPAEAVKENEVAATCKAAGSYDLVVYCSVAGCGAEISREAKTVDKLAHTPAEAVKENEVAATCTQEGSYDSVIYCSVTGCGAEISREAKTVAVLEHEYDLTAWGFKSAEGHAHDCKNCDAHDTLVAHTPNMSEPTENDPVKCTVCEYIITPATGHIKHTAKEEWVKDETHHWHECVGCQTEKLDYSEHNWGEGEITTAPTCTEKGIKTFTCECGKTKTEEVDSLGHKPAEAVEENKVESTCTEAGKYDLVVYCSVCEDEINRETKTIASEGHKLSDVAAQAPTCTTDGVIAHKHCSVCEKNFDGEENELSSIVDAAKHTPLEAVKENEIPATCTEDGSYDLVVYCSVCENELSRKTETITSEGHTPAEAVEENRVEATCTKDGSYDLVVYCSVCENELSRKSETIISEGHKVETYVSNGDATCTEDGTKTGECSVCHEMITITDEESALDHDWSEEKTLDATYELEGKVYKECNREGCDEEDIIEVLPQLVSVTEVKLSGEYYMDLGATQTIAATVSPEDAHDKTLTWTSSNDEIATVDENGLVTAIKAGKVTIQATSHNEIQEEVEILVLETVIDSEKDEFYDGVSKYSGKRTSPTVTYDAYVKLGENGIYVYDLVTDNSGEVTSAHIELYFTFGTEKVLDDSLSVHLYYNGTDNLRTYTYSSTSNVARNNNLKKYFDYSIEQVSDVDGVATYAYEVFVNYDYFGLTEKPESVYVHLRANSGTGKPVYNEDANPKDYKLLMDYEKFDANGYVPEMIIDGIKDDKYNSINAVVVEKGSVRPDLGHETYVYLGQKGIYIYHLVKDSTALTDAKTHVELYFQLGETSVLDNSVAAHLYPGGTNNFRTYTYSSASNVSSNNDIKKYFTYKINNLGAVDGVNTYAYEVFLDYTCFAYEKNNVAFTGLKEALTTLKLQVRSTSYQGGQLTNANKSGQLDYKLIENFLTFNKNGLVTTTE